MILSFHFTQSRLGCRTGVSAVEYCVVLGLIVGLSVAGLKLFGSSTANLLSNSNNRLSQHNTLSLLEPSHSNTSLNLPGSGYYVLLRNPKTGETGLKLVDGNQVSETNVTSVDGNRLHTLGSAMISKGLAQLSEKEKDPQLKDYYSKLAELSYYLGGAQGEMDSVLGLDINSQNNKGRYTRGDALRDIYQYQKELGALMESPPVNLSSASFNEVMPLVSTVYNIAQKYLNTFDQYIEDDGTVPENFGDPSRCDRSGSCVVGNGEPGSAIAYVNQIQRGSGIDLQNTSYRDLVDLDTLKKVSRELLQDKQVDSELVKSTLINAGEIDQHAGEPGTLLSPKVGSTSINGEPISTGVWWGPVPVQREQTSMKDGQN
jgi:hypothetical protein